jgi:S-adenosylmethionine:tRNA ribosyltransferase-isomerase
MKTLSPAREWAELLPGGVFAEAGLPSKPLQFELPPHLEASAPPEARGLARDQVRLMVSHYGDDRIVHTRFHHILDFLDPGDALVINTSGTLNAALEATRADGTPLELHLSTRLPADLWSVELRQSRKAGRQPDGQATRPFFEATAGETVYLAGGGTAKLLAPYRSHPGDIPSNGHAAAGRAGQVRLWVATLHLPAALDDYLARYGFPIRYRYVEERWPLSYYQTVYATQPGSAEMPSAGRAFTPELLTQLVARGVHVAPLILHTGVASLEDHEPPYEEFYRVPPETARLVNMARAAGGRVVAVGTTAVRALETVADPAGVVHPGQGWTDLVVTPQRGVRAIHGLLTGFHEPRTTHLAMLEALAGLSHLRAAYAEALGKGYLWHEFGDLHLILP